MPGSSGVQRALHGMDAVRSGGRVSRFDYVRYDEMSVKKQEIFKAMFEKIEMAADDLLDNSRAKSLLMTALEEAYMWSGKAIRDEQIKRGGDPNHQTARSNG
jgi:hypothetical protein